MDALQNIYFFHFNGMNSKLFEKSSQYLIGFLCIAAFGLRKTRVGIAFSMQNSRVSSHFSGKLRQFWLFYLLVIFFLQNDLKSISHPNADFSISIVF